MGDPLASVMHIFYQDREMQNFGSKTAILNAVTDQSSFSARILQINGTLRLLSKRELNEYHFERRK